MLTTAQATPSQGQCGAVASRAVRTVTMVFQPVNQDVRPLGGVKGVRIGERAPADLALRGRAGARPLFDR